MSEFNLALLGKWYWRLHVERGGLWYRVLTVRYGEEKWRICEGWRSASAWWECILRLSDGDGMGIGSWFDDNMKSGG
jgi:hypothetical protein